MLNEGTSRLQKLKINEKWYETTQNQLGLLKNLSNHLKFTTICFSDNCCLYCKYNLKFWQRKNKLKII